MEIKINEKKRNQIHLIIIILPFNYYKENNCKIMFDESTGGNHLRQVRQEI